VFVGVHEQGDVPPHQFLAGVAVHLTEGRIGGDDGAVHGVDDHAVACRFEDGLMLAPEAFEL